MRGTGKTVPRILKFDGTRVTVMAPASMVDAYDTGALFIRDPNHHVLS